MSTPLADLDELILRCRDEGARSHLAEAVRSYRAGAFRSSIVSTWVAVCFDIMEKLRELSLAGDAKATAKCESLERVRATGDISGALRFEKGLLALARDEFELISPLQYDDLERLYHDRNRCAHPSLIAEDTSYAPPAELARLHIFSAVDHLLQHPPVQGRFALERVLGAIESEYFPKRAEDAAKVLSTGPLRRPKDSLVRSVIIICLKKLVDDLPPGPEVRLVAALEAISTLHAALYEATIRAKWSTIVRSVTDDKLGNCTYIVRRIPFGWASLEADVVTRFQQYVANLPSDEIGRVIAFDNFAPLANFAAERIRRATGKELKNEIFFELTERLGDRFVELYLASDSFEAANSWVGELLSYKSDLTGAQIERTLRGIASNSQLTGSFRIGDLIRGLRGVERIPTDKFDRVLSESGLGDYIPSADDEEDQEGA